MTRVVQSFARTFFTPVRALLAILTIMVVVAVSSEETVASYQPGNCCGGFWTPTPPVFYQPIGTPTAPSAPHIDPLTRVSPTIGLTRIGTPIWAPVDFQLFSAPADPFPAAFNHVIDQLLPLEGPGAAVYTPHTGPYDTELSANAAAAGFVNQQVFLKSAITLSPNAVYFDFMLIPDTSVPGYATGSSRDFASGPIIPNSLFPFASKADMYLNGALVETLQDQAYSPRAGDLPYNGASHRSPTQGSWWPWANDPSAGPLGSYELKWSLRDNQGNGWDMSAPFQVVPEPSSLAISAAGMGCVAAARRRKSANR